MPSYPDPSINPTGGREGILRNYTIYLNSLVAEYSMTVPRKTSTLTPKCLALVGWKEQWKHVWMHPDNHICLARLQRCQVQRPALCEIFRSLPASEPKHLNTHNFVWKGCFSFVIISQLRRPIKLKFSQVCYIIHMLRYSKWEVVFDNYQQCPVSLTSRFLC